MSGWIVAVLAVVAAAALLAAWRLRRSAQHWRQVAEDAQLAMHQAQEALEQGRVAASLGDVVIDVVERLRPPPPSREDALATTRQALAQHCTNVREYDAAVQYCLQPVELMPGADEADLEHLLKFVSDARRRLFAARAKLLDGDALGQLAATLPAPVTAPPERGLLDSLADVAAAIHGGADLHTLLRDVGELARARSAGRLAGFRFEIGDLPGQMAPAWLGTVLLRLFDLAAAAAGDGGEVAAQVLRRDDGGFDIEAHARPEHSLPAEAFGDFERALDDMRHRLDERGVSLQAATVDARGRGFVLHLPDAAGAIASDPRTDAATPASGA